MGTERDPGLDALRGALMVAVIIGHFPTSARGLNPFGPLPEWLYFIHIPLFLALSCLFARPWTAARTGQRARQLLVPFAFWLAVSHPGQLLSSPWTLARDAAMGNWAHVQSVLWFLPALFTANQLMACWRRWGPPARVPLLVLVAATVLGAGRVAPRHDVIPFGLDVALFLFPFIGVVDQAWRRRERVAGAAGAWLVPAALAALALGGALVRVCERVKTHSAFARRVDFAQFSVPETLPGYLGMTLMGVALVLLASRLRAPRGLAAVGRRSMPIFLLHYPLLYVLTRGIGLAGESRLALLAYAGLVLAGIVAAGVVMADLLGRLSPRFALLGLAVPPARETGTGQEPDSR